MTTSTKVLKNPASTYIMGQESNTLNNYEESK